MTIKTWTVTTEHTVLSKVVVAGETEEEAMDNYSDGCNIIVDEEVYDMYDWEVVGIEEDIPQ